MNLADYATQDAVGLRTLLKAGEVSATEVCAAALDAIAAVNPQLNALAGALFDQPLEYNSGGPFAGVPFLIKDSGPMAHGVPYTCGSRFFDGVVAPADALVMQRFRRAGLATLGITTVPEMVISFATESRRYGVTRNPWAPERGTGGSSGGAAALVAAGAVPFAHGNDGAGSIRLPSACCGVVGLKPSRGRLPTGPFEWESFFGLGYHFGLVRTVRDAAHLLDALHGPGPGEKFVAPTPAGPYASELGVTPPRLRIGFTASPWSGVPIDPECAAAVEAVARALEQLGHEVEPSAPAIDGEDILHAFVPLTTAAVGGVMAAAPQRVRAEFLEAVSMTLFAEARRMTALDVAAGHAAANRIARTIGSFFADYDLLLTPTLAQLPAPHGALRYDDASHTVASWLESIFDYGPFTAPFNISGDPAISLPLVQSRDGLPIGIQLVAPYAREDRLFQIGAVLEAAMPWTCRRPAIWAGKDA